MTYFNKEKLNDLFILAIKNVIKVLVVYNPVT